MAHSDGTKSGGRKPGSRNKVQLTDAMRKDILSVYRSLGGKKWLLQWARENPTEFTKQALSRLMPPAPRAEAEIEAEQQTIAANYSVAQRIAFLLAQAAHGQPEPEMKVIEATPLEPVPEDVPARRLSKEELLADALACAPSTPLPLPPDEPESLENYRGASAEHMRSKR